MHKKGLAFILFVLCVSLMVGCSAEVMPYHIIEGDDGWRIELSDALKKENDPLNLGNCDIIREIHFKTLSDMRQRLIEADLTSEELFSLSRFMKDDDGNIVIPNLDNMYVPVLPEGVQIVSVSISETNSDCYRFNLKLGDEESGTTTNITYMSDKTFKDTFDNLYLGFLQKGYQVVSQTYEAERNADVYIYHVGNAERKMIVYTYKNDTGTYWIQEYYPFEYYDAPLETYVFCDTETADFQVFMFRPQQRPSFDFLTGFGMEPYKEA